MELKKAINNTKARHKRLKEQLEKGCYYGEQYNIQQEIEEEEIIIQVLEEYEKECRHFKAFCRRIRRDKENVDLFNQGQEYQCDQFLNLLTREKQN